MSWNKPKLLKKKKTFMTNSNFYSPLCISNLFKEMGICRCGLGSSFHLTIRTNFQISRRRPICLPRKFRILSIYLNHLQKQIPSCDEGILSKTRRAKVPLYLKYIRRTKTHFFLTKQGLQSRFQNNKKLESLQWFQKQKH